MNGMTKRVVVGETVVLVAWVIVMLACQNVLMSPFVFYTSLLFGLLAFVASAVSMALADHEDTAEPVSDTPAEGTESAAPAEDSHQES